MPFPAYSSEVATDADSIGMYARLLEPVTLVTATRGREIFKSSRALFARLEALGHELRSGAAPGIITAIWQGGAHVAAPGVAALEIMVQMAGLEPFNRASKAQRGGARALGTKYQWAFLGEYLGWTWERD